MRGRGGGGGMAARWKFSMGLGQLVVLVAMATRATLGAASRVPNPMQTVLLTDAVSTLGARCLDGTPQR